MCRRPFGIDVERRGAEPGLIHVTVDDADAAAPGVAQCDIERRVEGADVDRPGDTVSTGSTGVPAPLASSMAAFTAFCALIRPLPN